MQRDGRYVRGIGGADGEGFDRRAWMIGSSATLACGAALGAGIEPVPELRRQRFPRMVQEWYVDRVRKVLDAAKKRRAGLQNETDARAYLQEVRRKIALCFGPKPKKTPLRPRITKRIERDAYVIENVIFESRPNFLVSANLYLPRGKKGPFPGVVGTCGHSFNGKAAEAYQSYAQGLARLGYVVLIFDPIGQGERIQYLDENFKPTVGGGVRDHLMAGNQQYLVGEFIGSWRAWDGIRALDYLLTRPEVDKRHIGVTGNSGGGTMTTWLCGVERRWTMAAPSCFVTSMLRNLENELPQDTEQCPPRALELGLDHLDFLAAMAPKPVIILAKEKDFFDVRGSEEAYAELRSLYRLLGRPDHIGFFAGPGPHGYSQDNREAMYRWFNRFTGASDAKTEPPITLEPDDVLYAAPSGQVARLGSRTVFDFTRDAAQKMAKERRATLSADTLGKLLYQVLRIDRCADGSVPAEAPVFRILRSHSVRTKPPCHVTPYWVESSRGVGSVVYRVGLERLDARPRDRRPATLYVADQSGDHELPNEPLVAEALGQLKDRALYVCDVRGIGESRPATCGTGSYYSAYGNDYFYASHAIMWGTSVPAQRAWDILRVLAFLRAAGHRRVHLAARGWGTVPATFAALLHLASPPDAGPSIRLQRLTLKRPLRSFTEVASVPVYDWPLSSLVPNLLRHADLPDCYAALRKRVELALIAPVGPR